MACSLLNRRAPPATVTVTTTVVQLLVACLAVSTFTSDSVTSAEGISSRDSTPLPAFSWKTVPAFFHSSYLNSLTFPESAMKIITKFPIVTIEKWQGCKASDYTYEDDAMLAAAKQIKTANPEINVNVWFDSFRIYSNKSLNPSAIDNANQFCIRSRHSEFLESHVDYLLRNTSGDLAIESYCHLHVYDYVKPYVQEYWTQMCLNMTKSGYVDGCGCDGSQSRAADSGSVQVPHIAADYAIKWNAAKIDMMNTTRSALNGGLLLGKEPFEIGTYIDAILHEGCAANNQTILMLRNISALSKDLGRPLIVECHFSGVNENEVAAFLIGAGQYHYFGAGGWNGASFDSHWDDKLLGSTLGDPATDAVYDVESQVWARKFASGTSVAFNAKTKKGTIAWSG
ncbi:uncharacterized protein LOC135813184 [Sycon ciliatum]|uniref:uncharacterized protein LOC135813184 n=1 Tax=Sycon ciliatum TaxID=27933 RepID=UPI0031F644F4